MPRFNGSINLWTRSFPCASGRLGQLVLIDDEISTGNTFANLARACRTHAPAITAVHLAAITDFTGPTRNAQLADQFDTEWSVGALLYGQWHFEPNGQIASAPPVSQAPHGGAPTIVDKGFGRLGRGTCVAVPRERINTLAKGIGPADRVLVLGTGEFMHPAFVLARALHDTTGAKVFMHATSYPITHRSLGTDQEHAEFSGQLRRRYPQLSLQLRTKPIRPRVHLP